MQQTEHYGLNQWELTDRVLMSDFNADNLKLDAALGGKLGAVEILKESTSMGITIGNTSSEFFLSWEDWEFVGLLVHLPVIAGTTAPDIHYKLRVDSTSYLEIASLPYGSALVLFWPHHDLNREVQGILLGDTGTFHFRLDALFSGLSAYSVRATEGGRMASPNITIFGLR